MQHGIATHPIPPDSADLQDLRVLVVDDNATNRRILEETLTSWRMKPVSVDSARAALAALRDAVNAGDPFRLVLSDAMMPGIDGFALARAVRDDARLSGATLIMLTSAGLPQGRARAQEAGFAAYLSKPVKQSELLDAILTVFVRGGRAASAPPARRARRSPPRRGRRLSILLAEDNRDQSKAGRDAPRAPPAHRRRRAERP